jgi:hypothetical protein
MDYTFNGEVAKMYGVDEAVFIHNLYWWIAKNEANGRHYYDGRNWTYNSMDAFTKLFPFWSRRQVERIVRKLKDNGAIYIGNYNLAGFDRTQWYALSETVIAIYANGDTHFTESLNPFHQTVTPISPNGDTNTRYKPDINTDSKPDKEKKYKFGEYNHVILTDTEHKRLSDEFGMSVIAKYIKSLDEYLENNKKKHYDNHNLTIRNWIKRDNEKKSESGNPFLAMLKEGEV